MAMIGIKIATLGFLVKTAQSIRLLPVIVYAVL